MPPYRLVGQDSILPLFGGIECRPTGS